MTKIAGYCERGELCKNGWELYPRDQDLPTRERPQHFLGRSKALAIKSRSVKNQLNLEIHFQMHRLLRQSHQLKSS